MEDATIKLRFARLDRLRSGPDLLFEIFAFQES